MGEKIFINEGAAFPIVPTIHVIRLKSATEIKLILSSEWNSLFFSRNQLSEGLRKG